MWPPSLPAYQAEAAMHPGIAWLNPDVFFPTLDPLNAPGVQCSVQVGCVQVGCVQVGLFTGGADFAP